MMKIMKIMDLTLIKKRRKKERKIEENLPLLVKRKEKIP